MCDLNKSCFQTSEVKVQCKSCSLFSMKFSALKQVLFVRGHPSAFREGEVFATFSGFEGEVPMQILDFPIQSIHFHFFLSSR